MKTTMKIKVMGYRLWVIGMIALLPALAGAVEYKTTYGGIHSQPVYGVATTATNPSTTFQSTSSFAEQVDASRQESLLNADGTVNGEAYGIGRKNAPGVRKITGNPGVDPNDPGNVPLGEGLFALMLLAGGYAVARRRNER